LLAVTIQDLKQNPQEITAFYLQNMYQLSAADSNVSQASFPSTLAEPPPFSPHRYVVVVNSLWILSLVISLSTALLASLLQQWARRYVKLTQSPYSPPKRARLRAFFTHGLKRLHFPRAADAVPTLQHLSLFLFFVGLLILMWNTNSTVFRVVVVWVLLSTVVYVVVTLLPIFWPESPYYTPLSSPALLLYRSISFVFWKVLSAIRRCFSDAKADYRKLIRSVEKIAEEIVSEGPWEIDSTILDSTIDALSKEDNGVEQFFEVIPGFLNSNLIQDLKLKFPSELRIKLRGVLEGFVHRTFSSYALETVKIRRLVICLNAMDVIRCPGAIPQLLYNILDGPSNQVPQSIESGDTLVPWCTSKDKDIAEAARCMVVRILASVRERDSRWIELAVNAFCLPDQFLEDDTHEDNVLLSILTPRAHEAIGSASRTLRIPSSLSKISGQHTLPKLQRDFCVLWNSIISEAETNEVNNTFIDLLRRIRHAYVALHQGTEAAPWTFSATTPDSDPNLSNPLSYPRCNIPSHHSHPTPRTYAVAGEIPPRARAPVTTFSTVSQQGPAVTPISPPTRTNLSTSNRRTSPVIANPSAMEGITDISAIPGTSNPNPHSTSRTEFSQREVEESQIKPSSTAITSSPTAVSIPGPRNGVSPAGLLPSVDSVVETHNVSHSLTQTITHLSSITARQSVPPQVTMAQDRYTSTLSFGTAGVQDGSEKDMRPNDPQDDQDDL
jgi:hypothetical protein